MLPVLQRLGDAYGFWCVKCDHFDNSDGIATATIATTATSIIDMHTYTQRQIYMAPKLLNASEVRYVDSQRFPQDLHFARSI